MQLMDRVTEEIYEKLQKQGKPKLADMYRNCFRSTWDTTLQRSDGTVFLITGDIPAMWLRDSSAQVFHYLLDPYTNAFNREASGRHGYDDRTNWTEEQKPWIWERKYEIDSLCYPIRLAYTFWKETGSTAWCDELFR